MSGEEMLDLLEYLDEDLIMESAGFGGADRKTRRNMNPKKLVVVLLAAALVLALGVMAVSAAVRHDWDRAIRYSLLLQFQCTFIIIHNHSSFVSAF